MGQNYDPRQGATIFGGAGGCVDIVFIARLWDVGGTVSSRIFIADVVLLIGGIA
jgi:hypothetical protein